MRCFLLLLSVCLFQLSFAQVTALTAFVVPSGKALPIKIIAQTDSSVFFVGKKIAEKNIWDLYISKRSAFKDSIDFEVCLDVRKIYNGSFNIDNVNFEYMQSKNNIIFLFTAISPINKILFAKIISYEGEVSEPYIIDRTDYTNENLESCSYSYYLTSKKNILVFNQRAYKSGFERDKCILLDNFLNKVWEYELPAINAHNQENLIADVDNANNLIFYNLFFDTYTYFNTSNNLVAQKVYSYSKSSTKIKYKLGRLEYDLLIREDSINLFFLNAFKKEIISRKLYYPFLQFPIIKSLTSTQLLMYNVVDIEDEKYIFPGKKGMYYKRFDLKNDTVLLDTLLVMSDKLQRKLSYNYGPGGKRPTGKYFKLLNENYIDGKLISVFEHIYNGQFLELLACNYNVTLNKFEWNQLVPRKINIYYPDIYDVVTRYYDNKLSLSFYEHPRNASVNANYTDFDAYKLLRKPHDKVFVSYTFTLDGDVEKTNQQKINDSFMFPWIGDKKNINHSYFFAKRDFLPLEFLYKTK
ncbi:MAG: hypothetical protein V4580_04585 [Bacteroidota bacterium]